MATDKHLGDWFLPVAFYFSVNFHGDPEVGEVAFREVSGLSAEIELETLVQGGVNDYELRLPKTVKHGNLVMKRAIMPLEGGFGEWVRETLEYGLAKRIRPRNIVITLRDESGDEMYWWTCAAAYPVKWNTDSFDSLKNEVAVECLEFTYTTLTRGQ